MFSFPPKPADGSVLTVKNGVPSYQPAVTSTGTSSSSVGINYISNSSGESGTTGWVTYADAAAVTPVDGVGGSPVTTWTRTTVTPLRGTWSFVWTKDAVNRQGEGVSFDFTIDRADRNKALTISFDVETISGSFAPGDLAVFVYDITGAQLLPIASNNSIQATGTAQLQFTSNGNTAYRLIIHTVTTNASAYSLEFDNITVSPTYVPIGIAITDWQTYTPVLTGVGTATAVTAEWRRVGAEMELRGSFTTGTVAAVTFGISLPQGTIDTLGGTGSDHQIVGSCATNDTANGNIRFIIAAPGDTTLSGTANSLTLTKQTGSILFNSSVRWSFFAKVKIVGWSGTQAVQPSSRYLWAQRFAANATRVTTTPSAPGQYRARRLGVDTAPTSAPAAADGFRIDAGSGIAAGRINQYDIYIGPGKVVSLTSHLSVGRTGLVSTDLFTSGSDYRGINWSYDPQTGVLSAFCRAANAGDQAAVAFDASATYASVYFDLLVADDPVPLALAPAVHVEASDTSGQVLVSGSVLQFSTKTVDTHGAWTGSNTFTAPVAGIYLISCAHYKNAVVTSVLDIWVSGSLHTRLAESNAGVGTQDVTGARQVQLAQGASVQIKYSGAGYTSSTVATINWISITRVGP